MSRQTFHLCFFSFGAARRWGWGGNILVILPLSLPFPFPFPLSSVVEGGGLSVGDGMVRDGWRCFGGIGGGGS